MPSPLEILIDPVSIAALMMYASLMLWEAVFPARPLPVMKGWRLRGIAAYVVYFFLSSYLPLFWDAHLARYQLLDLTGLGTAAGAVIGLLVYEAVLYFWHRAIHGSSVLWRGFHQMHHSAERLDTFGAFYLGPLDMIGFTFVGSFALVLIVGVTPAAATIVILATTFFAIFQHANIRTPRWLGYLVQRPESHSVHHGRNIHYYNFADLPVFDMVFGTFRNPAAFNVETGFYPGGSERVLDMVLARDITGTEVFVPAASAAE